MNRSYITALLFVVSVSLATAQNSAIKVNVLSPMVRTANFSFEQKLGPETSLQLGFFYTSAKFDGDRYTGIGVTPEFRYYLTETEAIRGFYIAPFLRYNKINIKTTSTYTDGNGNTTTEKVDVDLNGFGGGVVVGKQWVFKEHITIDMFVGPKGMSRNIKVNSGNDADVNFRGFGGFGIRAGITFGVAF